jgi:hypothetical protein
MVLAVSPQGNRENGEIRMKTILLLLGFFILTGCREPHEMPQTGGSNPTLLPEMSQRGDQNMQKQTIKISVQVPDSAWNLNIREIYQTSENLVVIAYVERPPDVMGAQAITTLTDEVTVPALTPELPVKIYILGKTWGWENEEPYLFIRNRSEIAESLDDALKIYSQSEHR